jgi:hypothetical protein
MDDEGDFKKARGFLLTYSALVLALWYFGADLSQFKLMGNEVKLHQRTESVWLVLAGLNVYFWFRFYQHIPPLGLYFDERMNDLYDGALEWLTTRLKRRMLGRGVREWFFAPSRDPSEKMKITGYHGKATARDSLDEDRRTNGDEVPELHQISRVRRTKMRLVATFSYTEQGIWKPSTGYFHLDYEPSAAVTYPAKTFAIFRGAFVTPWFTDHIAPLVFGLISTGFALWKWCDMNFTTTLPHLAQSCAGVTH